MQIELRCRCLGCPFVAGGTTLAGVVRMAVAHADKSQHQLELYEHRTLRVIGATQKEAQNDQPR
jgi:hypothetical protein